MNRFLLRAALVLPSLFFQSLQGAEADKTGERMSLIPDGPSVTQHSVMIDGVRIDYTATTGMLTLRDETEAPTADVFYIAYTRDNGSEAAARPVTFSFNGGPGASSVWMHLGLLGPKRVVVEDDGRPVAPPYALVENECSLLDETDLVFIDPVSTGFSRAKTPEQADPFHGVEGDTAAVADFIRLYCTRNERWTSPKFIIGESYGTTRAAALAGELFSRHHMNLNGIMLVSAVLNFQTIRFVEGNDLPHILFLPAYTATAWYHNKLPPALQSKSLEEVLAAAEAFAAGPYQTGLFAGSELPPRERKELVAELARFTGLSPAFLERVNLRPTLFAFAAELLRDEGRVIGRFDGRYSGPMRQLDAPQMPYDPSATATFSAYASTFHDYVRRDLGYVTDRPYEILSRQVWPWDWGENNRYLNVGPNLADALTRQQFLRVHIDNGYYDLATPYWATHYTLNHLGLPPSVRGRVSMSHYQAGHMMYFSQPDLKAQKANLARFIRASTPKP
jgi:carboxypeptidase C (cathepsin A)